MNNKSWLEGNRKLVIAALAVVAAGVAVCTGVITGDKFQEIITWVVGLFMGGNVIEHTTKKGNGNGTSG